jgi:hypothetical protein
MIKTVEELTERRKEVEDYTREHFEEVYSEEIREVEEAGLGGIDSFTYFYKSGTHHEKNFNHRYFWEKVHVFSESFVEDVTNSDDGRRVLIRFKDDR